jgi:1-acyl-sn-glycerol-3-phosphate acyltransferase
VRAALPVVQTSRRPLVTRLIWAIGRAAAWVFYRVERIGPPVPDGPVLLIANHPNMLLDPVLVVTTAGRAPRFLAKSTLFSHAIVGAVVRAAGAIPVYRRQDAGADTARNVEMFAAVEEALVSGDAVCVFPEGISHSSGRLEPLRTGAARIALAAAARGVTVQIVPVGLNFQQKAVFRSKVTVAFGPPIDASRWVDAWRADEARAVRECTAELADHLRDLLVEAEPTTDVELVNRVERLYATARELPPSPQERLERRRLIAGGLYELRARDPRRYAQLYAAAERYVRTLSRFGLTDTMLGRDVPWRAVARFAIRESMIALVLVPIAAAALALFAVPYGAVHLFSSGLRLSLEEHATYKLVGGLIVYLLWTVALVTAAGLVAGRLVASAALALIPIAGIAGLYAAEREASVLETVRAWLAARATTPRTKARLLRQRTELAELLDETYTWLTRETR